MTIPTGWFKPMKAKANFSKRSGNIPCYRDIWSSVIFSESPKTGNEKVYSVVKMMTSVFSTVLLSSKMMAVCMNSLTLDLTIILP